MFSPGANRLCKFLEICALSVQLASQGGVTGKQGYLRIASSGASRKQASGLHPLIFKRSSDSKWFIVRDSCIVAVEDPSSVSCSSR
jgi:phospholipase D1/2